MNSVFNIMTWLLNQQNFQIIYQEPMPTYAEENVSNFYKSRNAPKSKKAGNVDLSATEQEATQCELSVCTLAQVDAERD